MDAGMDGEVVMRMWRVGEKERGLACLVGDNDLRERTGRWKWWGFAILSGLAALL